MRNRPGGRMSGGEQQMLTIARTLVRDRAVIIEKGAIRYDATMAQLKAVDAISAVSQRVE